MHIVVVGGRGQLGSAMQAELAQQTDWPGAQVTIWNRPDYDLSNARIADQLAELRPDLVINAAAWTNVDGAEANPDAAYAANALGPLYLAQGCNRCGAALVQISTNEVFAGMMGRFYREDDDPHPASIYARSKLAGEMGIHHLLDRLYIVRVSWLFGPQGNNFPAKILAAADKHGALRVVRDEFGNPTYAPDAARAIWQLAQTGHFGIYHLINEGYASRFQLAQAVLHACNRDHIPIAPITSAEWTRATMPPAHAVLLNEKAAALGITLRPWQEALAAYLNERIQARNEQS